MPKDKSEKSWVNLEFSGYEPDDQRSSLLRRWKAQIVAMRSDGEVFTIVVVSEQSDTPYRVGVDMANAFLTLETFRNCPCTSTFKCPAHLGAPVAETV